MQRDPSRTSRTRDTDAAEFADAPTLPLANRVLTVAEVARELRCSKAHIHHLMNGKVQGTPPLPSLLLGRRRLVRRESLDVWLKTNEHRPAQML